MSALASKASADDLPPFPFAGEHGLAFRRESREDFPFLETLYASTRQDELAATGWPVEWQTQFLEQQFQAQFDHYQRHYADADRLIILSEEERAGRLYLEEWPSQLRIIDIALLPRFRGQGFGQAILEDVKRMAVEADKSVSIHVEKNNPAMSLYQRLGFRKQEDKGVYDLMVCIG